MNEVEGRWIAREVELRHSTHIASSELRCECCGFAAAHLDVEGVSLCCECVAAETLEEQRQPLRKAYAEAASTYDQRREERLRNIADQGGKVVNGGIQEIEPNL